MSFLCQLYGFIADCTHRHLFHIHHLVYAHTHKISDERFHLIYTHRRHLVNYIIKCHSAFHCSFYKPCYKCSLILFEILIFSKRIIQQNMYILFPFVNLHKNIESNLSFIYRISHDFFLSALVILQAG